jgi:hemerythrin
MALYEFDDRSVTGHADIDHMHAEIATLSRRLAERVEKQADFSEVCDIFLQLQAALLEHFELEERYILTLPQNDDVRAHLRKHTENHNQFRDLLTYGGQQFELKSAAGEVPNVTSLIPQEYFEELKNIDREMRLLFAKYVPEKRAPHEPAQ